MLLQFCNNYTVSLGLVVLMLFTKVTLAWGQRSVTYFKLFV